MSIETLRVLLKTGPWSPLYRYARNIKRRVRREPMQGAALPVYEDISLAELKNLLKAFPDYSRLHYSIGCLYVSGNEPRKAAACLRSALHLDFEGIERANLYLAQCFARVGMPEQSFVMADTLKEEVFQEQEKALLERLLSRAELRDEKAVLPEFLSARAAFFEELARSNASLFDAANVLIIGDDEAVGASMFLGCRVFYVAEPLNGLTPNDLENTKANFDVTLCHYSAKDFLDDHPGICGKVFYFP